MNTKPRLVLVSPGSGPVEVIMSAWDASVEVLQQSVVMRRPFDEDEEEEKFEGGFDFEEDDEDEDDDDDEEFDDDEEDVEDEDFDSRDFEFNPDGDDE